MINRIWGVAVYKESHWLTTVRFRTKWQAALFHTIINRSKAHKGVRQY